MPYGDDKATIIGQHVRFCKVLNEQIGIFGSTNEAVTETIRICKDENVLKSYLISHEQEAVSIMMALFNEEYIQKAYGHECLQQGLQQGLEQGKLDAKRETAMSLAAEGSDVAFIAKVLHVTEACVMEWTGLRTA